MHNILIICSGINFIDLSGAEVLAAESQRLKKMGGGLFFADLKPAVYEFLAESCFIREVGNDHFYDSKKEAISGIYKVLNRETCSTCSAQVFNECRL